MQHALNGYKFHRLGIQVDLQNCSHTDFHQVRLRMGQGSIKYPISLAFKGPSEKEIKKRVQCKTADSQEEYVQREFSQWRVPCTKDSKYCLRPQEAECKTVSSDWPVRELEKPLRKR